MKKKIRAPDLMILFTGTVSHKMVNCAVEEAKKSLSQSADVIQAVRLLLKAFSVNIVHKN